MEFRIECRSDDYQFVHDGEDGSSISTTGVYGETPAIMELEGDIFYCWIEDGDDPEPQVCKVDSVSICESTLIDDGEWTELTEPREAGGPTLVETEDAG